MISHADMLPLVHEPGGLYNFTLTLTNHTNPEVAVIAVDLPHDEEAKKYAEDDALLLEYFHTRHDRQTVNIINREYIQTLAKRVVRIPDKGRNTQLDLLATSIDLSDSGNADFAEKYLDGRAKFEAENKVWYFADKDERWNVDRTGEVFCAVGLAMRAKLEATVEHVDVKDKSRHTHALRSCDSVKITHCLQVLCARRTVAVAAGTFDANPYLLGCENAVLNLEKISFDRNGELSLAKIVVKNSRSVLVAKRAGVSFDPAAKCERWVTYLEKVQPDENVRSALAEILGAMLTGIQPEKCFIVMVGRGGNGKSVATRVEQDLLGDYSFSPRKALIFNPRKNAGEQAAGPNDLSDTIGARGLFVSEQAGRGVNTESVKALTGGEKQHARQLYGVGKNFTPSAKIIATVNEEPRMEEVDEAIRRRFALIRWPVTLLEEEKEPFEPFIASLETEMAGILNWALDGLAIIKNNWKLRLPESVKKDTEGYLLDQDDVGEFLKTSYEDVSITEKEKTPVTEIYERFKIEWLEEEKFVISKRMFTNILRAHYGKSRVVRGGMNKMIVLHLRAKTTTKGLFESEEGAKT